MIKPILSPQELRYVAMKHIGTLLEKEGYEFLAVNSELNSNPQFVLFKKGEPQIFVIVKETIFPKNHNKYDLKFINKMIDHAKKNNAKLWYAGVGFANEKDLEAPLYRDESYLIKFDGIQKVL